MRLWHQNLLYQLPQQWILGQHRELCGLRGKGWRYDHKTVDYIHDHPFEWLIAFHHLLIHIMLDKKHGIVSHDWVHASYRGKKLGWDYRIDDDSVDQIVRNAYENGTIIYPEHDNDYYDECIENLKIKGIYI